jgi:Papain-like cysteine protease AvrRpt2
MTILLNVPFVTQLDIDSKGRNDPTGCWYASVCMIGYYFEAGPRQGIPELFKRDLGKGLTGHYATGSAEANKLCKNHHDLLAEREQLAPVPLCETAHVYTTDELENLLKSGGPIFLYWMKTYLNETYGHASVIIGVDENQRVIYHDPEKLPNSKMSIGQFHAVRQQWKYSLMQRKK